MASTSSLKEQFPAGPQPEGASAASGLWAGAGWGQKGPNLGASCRSLWGHGRAPAAQEEWQGMEGRLYQSAWPKGKLCPVLHAHPEHTQSALTHTLVQTHIHICSHTHTMHRHHHHADAPSIIKPVCMALPPTKVPVVMGSGSILGPWTTDPSGVSSCLPPGLLPHPWAWRWDLGRGQN